MPVKYWDAETPLIADTGKNILRYFSKAMKLQVSNPYWLDKEGQQKNGKTVTLDIAAAAENAEAIRLLKTVMKDVEAQGRQ